MIYHSANFEWNQCIHSKVIEEKQYLYLVFYPNNKNLSGNRQQLGQNFAHDTNIELELYFTMIYPSANFQRNQCIPAKLLSGVQYQHTKIGHNLPKIFRMITNIELDLYFTIISFCRLSIKSTHLCKWYWSETNINTPTKTCKKRTITQPKFGGW